MSAGMSMILQSEIRITELLQEPLSKIFLTIGFARPAESARRISVLRTKVNTISLWRPSVCRHFFVLWERRGERFLGQKRRCETVRWNGRGYMMIVVGGPFKRSVILALAWPGTVLI